MFRQFTLMILAAAAAGCSSPPLVYSSTDVQHGEPTGTVHPLRELLPADGSPVRLVFVHGVGDHCSGYALDPKNGWLNTRMMEATGLAPTSAAPRQGKINVSVFMGGSKDEKSRVEYAVKTFTLRIPGLASQVNIEAIEITWSPLTQWLKSNQLGYDAPSTTPAAGSAPKGCVAAPDADVPPTVAPPPRLLLDRVLKESVLDRNLADALLYSGSYGAVMERGLAEALCHAVTQTADDRKCQWPAPGRDLRQRPKYIFATHSLGSRMTYDMFLDLLGYSTAAKPNPFGKEEREAAHAFVEAMLNDTRAFYMMANQLAFLGLANVPTNARSGTGIHPYARGIEVAGLPNQVAPAVGSVAFGNVIAAIAQVRSVAAKTASESPTMQIVSFNDTNDLLTWHVPSWYANDVPKAADGRPLIDVVNVFVQNAPKLLVLELPAPAHGNYFLNPDVWRVIACGYSSGKPRPCL